MAWQNTQNIRSHSYKCGWCGRGVASVSGYYKANSHDRIYICPNCVEPTYFSEERQTPGVAQGEEVSHLPNDVKALYREARDCAAASCYTASVLICRKLLMNIAVSHGAQPGGTFVSYVEHLADSGFVPPNGRGWVDHIRTKGNEATHEISLMTNDDADDLISFVEMLLKFIFEFPNRIPAP